MKRKNVLFKSKIDVNNLFIHVILKIKSPNLAEKR